MRRLLKSITSLILLVSIVASLPIIGYADRINISQSAGGVGGGIQRGGGGKWGTAKQGLRISILDYSGNPAFTFGWSGSKRLDLLWEYPSSTYSLWGARTKVDEEEDLVYSSINESRTENYVLTLGGAGGFIDHFTGEYEAKMYTVMYGPDDENGKLSTAISNLKNLETPIYAKTIGKDTTWAEQGEKIRQRFMGTSKTDELDPNGVLYTILHTVYTPGMKWMWQPIADADLGDNPFTAEELAAYNTLDLSPIQLIKSRGLIISVEPIIFATLRLGENSWSAYSVYGTQTDIGQIMQYLINNKTDFASATGKNTGGYDTKIFGEHGRRSLVTTKNVTFYPSDGSELTITPPSGGHNITNAEVSTKTPGWALHLYQFAPSEPITHTWDSENYPDKSTFEEHPAPDPKEDPVSKSNVTQSDLHYRIVKVYEQEILNEDGYTTTIEHVATKTRAPTVSKIKIQDETEPGGYSLIEWKYGPEYYGGPEGTENGQDIEAPPLPEDTPWDTTVKCDNPTDLIEKVPQDPTRSGTEETTVDIKDKGDKSKVITLYVRLRKKYKIPETSTFDEPDNPPSGNPPVVPPHASDDPFQPTPSDPETTPVKPDDILAHYRIVKVYETEHEDTGLIDTDAIFCTFRTNPIVYIQDEAQKGTPDYSYHLLEWKYGDEFNGEKWNNVDKSVDDERDDWDKIVNDVTTKGAGTTVSKIDLRDKDNIEETVTLYVRLRRKIGDKVPGDIIIEQSQISKTIHSNDTNIGGRFGDYSFAMTIGNFRISHTAYYDHCCVPGDHRYHTCRCLGHTCFHEMPGRAGDNQLNFNFDLISGQHDLEIPKGVFSKTDPKVYGQGGSSFDAITTGVDYPRTISSLYASDNKWYFTSDGNNENGAEYVPVLWRCSKNGLNDIPTLAKFKQNDITKRYGAENYTIPDTMLSSVGSTANKISNKKRASAPMAFAYDFTFGLHSRSDITATSSCVTHNGYNCIDTDTQDYYPIEGTQFTYDFKAQVGIQFYAGTAKGLMALPFGGTNANPILEKTIGKHSENNIIQCKQQIKWYPYIRMTYMVNSLEDAIKEEQNVDAYNQDVRKDTYVLSEWESSVLPADAVTVSWKNDNENESLLLTSQQWSVHQKATNGTDGWQGKNQVLPGGAIYQLSTPQSNWTTVNITTYQTVVDEKARNEYLSAALTGDEYTESKVAKDHLDFINDAKEVLDNLKIVQWVNKNVTASTAWAKNFEEKDGDGAICLRGLGEKLRPDLGNDMKETANTDAKYYMRKQTQLSNYQNVTKLSDWTKTIDDAQNIKEQVYEGDLDVFNMRHQTTVYKLFTDTSGNVYLASMTKQYGTNDTGMDNTENDIKQMVQAMKDLNADTYAMGQTYGATITKLCDKKTTGTAINGVLFDDAKEIDDLTSFITNFVSALTRNKGTDYTAEWASGTSDGKWYNEAFDGVYMVKQSTTFNIGLVYTSSRVSALDPALCPPNKGQSDLYTKAFLSQFCLDSQSDAAIAQGKKLNYLGTFKDTDITMPDMESMYVSKKFYIPNANVQDLN